MSATPALALLGTSADPPTEGHRALLEGLAEHYGQVATWASDNPFKQHGATLELRAQLLGALVEALGDPRIHHVQALSHPRALITLERAAERWPGQELVFVVGGRSGRSGAELVEGRRAAAALPAGSSASPGVCARSGSAGCDSIAWRAAGAREPAGASHRELRNPPPSQPRAGAGGIVG